MSLTLLRASLLILTIHRPCIARSCELWSVQESMVQLQTTIQHPYSPMIQRRLDWVVMYSLETLGWLCQTATLTIHWTSSNSTVRWAPLPISQLSRQRWLRTPPMMMASMGWCPWTAYYQIISGIASLYQVMPNPLYTHLVDLTDFSSRLFQYHGGPEWWFRVWCRREWINHTSLGSDTRWFWHQHTIAWRPELEWVHSTEYKRCLQRYDKIIEGWCIILNRSWCCTFSCYACSISTPTHVVGTWSINFALLTLVSSLPCCCRVHCDLL